MNASQCMVMMTATVQNPRRAGPGLLIGLTLFLSSLLPAPDALAQRVPQTLHSGWYPRAPYQMETRAGALDRITGLDIELARELFEGAGHRVSFPSRDWSELMEGLREGRVDFVMGSYFVEDRTAFAHYSAPYRTEENIVYYRRDIAALDQIVTVAELIGLLQRIPIRIAVTEGYAYGSPEFADLIRNPPNTVTLVDSSGYADNIRLVTEDKADLFVSNPIIMDRMLAESELDQLIQRAQPNMGEIPIHILFSKQTFTEKQVAGFNARLRELRTSGRIRDLHIAFVLPVYLAITTGQDWFYIINLFGIAAFCTSGVLLARKERYNLFGALVLATLPAIGGGVLRDLVLGVEPIFVLETPVYVLAALTVVCVAFIGFKVYDLVHDQSREWGQRIDRYTERHLGGLFDRLFRFFDAWAVATFTIIGVSVAVETKAAPLWLWGPAMGVLTASGGVILRDMVRADFNIDMLKRDSYAEIAILGGILYTTILTRLPYSIGLDRLFAITVLLIAGLFAIRFFVLWKGYDNPLQFGAKQSRPEARLNRFTDQEAQLWLQLTRFYGEDSDGKAQPVGQAEREIVHNKFLYQHAALRRVLDSIATEPLSEQAVAAYRRCAARMDLAATIEDTLFFFTQHTAPRRSRQAAELQQRVHESLKTLLETTAGAAASGDPTDFDMLDTITDQQQERFSRLRTKYAQPDEGEDPDLSAVLQATHKVERFIYLLGDYARLRQRLSHPAAGSVTSRRTQQMELG